MASNQAEFLALYGRRRVGKTFLIRQYLSNNLVFDISGTNEGSKEQQLTNFFGEYLKRTKGEQVVGSDKQHIVALWSRLGHGFYADKG